MRYILATAGNKEFYIPYKQAEIVRKNFKAGKPWHLCSPMYSLTRQQVAAIGNMTAQELIAACK